MLWSFLIPQAYEVLQSFLQSEVATEKSILQAGEALTYREKAIAGMGQGLTLSRVGMFLQCPLTDRMKSFPK